MLYTDKDNVYLDTEHLRHDLIKYMHKHSLSQKQLVEKIGVSRSVFYRLQHDYDMKFSTFLKLIVWLEKDLNYYLKTKKDDKSISTTDLPKQR